jgi:cytochrome b subunit of formate dehydrogenase
VRGIMILLHEIAPLATIGVYVGVFMVPRSMTAITTGYVRRAWAWMHHRLWYLRITGQK